MNRLDSHTRFPCKPETRNDVPVPVSTGASLEIRYAPGKGRGVFAGEAVEPNQTLICDPVERYRLMDARHLARHSIYPHLFVDPDHYGLTDDVDLLWVLGAISIVNHSNTPNCRVEWSRDALGEWAILRSIAEIRANCELLIRYTNIDEYPDHGKFV